jgi:hypothetical protein
MTHDDGNPQPAGPATAAPCRFGWAVPGGTSHVCYRDHGHEPPHRCSYCALEHDATIPQDQDSGTDPV